MRKHHRRLLSSILLLAASAIALSQKPSPRTLYNFNPGWLVQVGDPVGAEAPTFDDSNWKHISTPYAWNEASAFRVSIHDLPTGVAWYRKHFRLPSSSAGQKVFIEFEGIRQAGDVYLNGTFIGRHEDGVMAFGFDLTPHLKPTPQENVLAVRTDNRWDYREKSSNTTFQWNNANFYANYGGISKNVWLHITAPLHQTLPLFSSLGTTGTYIYATDIKLPSTTAGTASARITAETQVRNDYAAAKTIHYTVRIENPQAPQHHTVAQFDGGSTTLAPNETRTLTASATVPNLHLWSWGYGYLYDVVTTLTVDGRPIDSVTTRTAFRKTEFDHGMVKLNGLVIQFHGYAQRTTNEWPAVGLSVPPWMSDLSNGLMVQGNGNLVRWMHVTPWKQDVESSDRVGLPQSMPAGDAEGDAKGRQWQQRVELMRDAVIYNRNNPSILFYESGNKGVSEQHLADMKAVRDQYDPHGGRALGAREMLASHTAEYGGEMLYINKSATKPLWSHEYNRDEGARAFRDEDTPPFHKDSPLYNRNQDSFTIEDVLRWYDYYAERPGSGTRVSSGGVNIVFADSNTHFRGDNNYRRSGEVDAMRIPKDAYFAHKVMWDSWVDIEHPATFILGHWNYAANTTRPIHVVSTAEKVELKLNGRSLGFGAQSARFLFTFPDVAFIPGTLEAIGYNAYNKPVTHTELKTIGVPTQLRLTPHTGPSGLRADGADMALVDVEVLDAKGNRVPTAFNKIHFSLNGPAEWRGGIAQGTVAPAPPPPPVPNDNHGLSATPPTPRLHEDNYILSQILPVEDGINRVLLRANPNPGVITLTATAEGLTPTTITLNSHTVAITNGLSTDLPQRLLTPNLERGPTPIGPSFIPWRTSIPIVSVTAGANADSAPKSFDDDETTSWSNDGNLNTAWIEYTLPTGSTPSAIGLRLNAFRTRHYPLRITLDGKTLYEGTTATTLGYITLPLQQDPSHSATGTHLRIALTAPPVDGEHAAGTEEITGKYDGAGVAPTVSDGKALLNVIEADIFESVRSSSQSANRPTKP